MKTFREIKAGDELFLLEPDPSGTVPVIKRLAVHSTYAITTNLAVTRIQCYKPMKDGMELEDQYVKDRMDQANKEMGTNTYVSFIVPKHIVKAVVFFNKMPTLLTTEIGILEAMNKDATR